MRDAGVLRRGARARNVGVDAVEIEFSARPRWLQGRELHVLLLETHLESVFAVNLGEVVRHLEGGADFIRRQEGVAAQSLQPRDSEGGKPAVFVLLRDALDAKLSPADRSDHWPKAKPAWCEGSSVRPAQR